MKLRISNFKPNQAIHGMGTVSVVPGVYRYVTILSLAPGLGVIHWSDIRASVPRSRDSGVVLGPQQLHTCMFTVVYTCLHAVYTCVHARMNVASYCTYM